MMALLVCHKVTVQEVEGMKNGQINKYSTHMYTKKENNAYHNSNKRAEL